MLELIVCVFCSELFACILTYAAVFLLIACLLGRVRNNKKF